MNKEEAEKKYLEYLEGHIDNVKSALDILISLDIPFINDNKNELLDIVSKHDESKYEDPEWTAYLHHWYPTSDEDSLKALELLGKYHKLFTDKQEVEVQGTVVFANEDDIAD